MNSRICEVCLKRVYAMDPQINLDRTIYHMPCAKCADCNCQITISNCTISETTDNAVLLCKVHYLSRINEGGKNSVVKSRCRSSATSAHNSQPSTPRRSSSLTCDLSSRKHENKTDQSIMSVSKNLTESLLASLKACNLHGIENDSNISSLSPRRLEIERLTKYEQNERSTRNFNDENRSLNTQSCTGSEFVTSSNSFDGEDSSWLSTSGLSSTTDPLTNIFSHSPPIIGENIYLKKGYSTDTVEVTSEFAASVSTDCGRLVTKYRSSQSSPAITQRNRKSIDINNNNLNDTPQEACLNQISSITSPSSKMCKELKDKGLVLGLEKFYPRLSKVDFQRMNNENGNVRAIVEFHEAVYLSPRKNYDTQKKSRQMNTNHFLQVENEKNNILINEKMTLSEDRVLSSCTAKTSGKNSECIEQYGSINIDNSIEKIELQTRTLVSNKEDFRLHISSSLNIKTVKYDSDSRSNDENKLNCIESARDQTHCISSTSASTHIMESMVPVPEVNCKNPSSASNSLSTLCVSMKKSRTAVPPLLINRKEYDNEYNQLELGIKEERDESEEIDCNVNVNVNVYEDGKSLAFCHNQSTQVDVEILKKGNRNTNESEISSKSFNVNSHENLNENLVGKYKTFSMEKFQETDEEEHSQWKTKRILDKKESIKLHSIRCQSFEKKEVEVQLLDNFGILSVVTNEKDSIVTNVSKDYRMKDAKTIILSPLRKEDKVICIENNSFSDFVDDVQLEVELKVEVDAWNVLCPLQYEISLKEKNTDKNNYKEEKNKREKDEDKNKHEEKDKNLSFLFFHLKSFNKIFQSDVIQFNQRNDKRFSYSVSSSSNKSKLAVPIEYNKSFSSLIFPSYFFDEDRRSNSSEGKIILENLFNSSLNIPNVKCTEEIDKMKMKMKMSRIENVNEICNTDCDSTFDRFPRNVNWMTSSSSSSSSLSNYLSMRFEYLISDRRKLFYYQFNYILLLFKSLLLGFFSSFSSSFSFFSAFFLCISSYFSSYSSSIFYSHVSYPFPPSFSFSFFSYPFNYFSSSSKLFSPKPSLKMIFRILLAFISFFYFVQSYRTCYYYYLNHITPVTSSPWIGQFNATRIINRRLMHMEKRYENIAYSNNWQVIKTSSYVTVERMKDPDSHQLYFRVSAFFNSTPEGIISHLESDVLNKTQKIWDPFQESSTFLFTPSDSINIVRKGTKQSPFLQKREMTTAVIHKMRKKKFFLNFTEIEEIIQNHQLLPISSLSIPKCFSPKGIIMKALVDVSFNRNSLPFKGEIKVNSIYMKHFYLICHHTYIFLSTFGNKKKLKKKSKVRSIYKIIKNSILRFKNDMIDRDKNDNEHCKNNDTDNNGDNHINYDNQNNKNNNDDDKYKIYNNKGEILNVNVSDINQEGNIKAHHDMIQWFIPLGDKYTLLLSILQVDLGSDVPESILESGVALRFVESLISLKESIEINLY